MESELRELDARFARDVLGWTNCDPTYVSSRWEFTDPPDDPVVTGVGDDPEYGRRPIPRYTRSLDATWLGIDTLKSRSTRRYNMIVTLQEFHKEGWRCQLGDQFYGDEFCGHSTSQHPAEAIVRACLSAVEGRKVDE